MWCQEHEMPLSPRTRICPTVKMAYQHLVAANDRGDNPQSAWAIYDLVDGDIVTAIDAGHLGIKAISQAGFDRDEMIELPSFNVSVDEYSTLMREHSRGLIEWPLSQMHRPRSAST